MERFLTVLAVLTLVSGPLHAQDARVNSDQPGTYVVQEGDTLWDIAARFLVEPWTWPEIWESNPQIQNPHLIYPGDVISLTYRDGRAVLGLSRSVRLSPTVRSFARDQAIPPIPLSTIAPFLSRPLVVEEGTIDAAPYIVATQDDHLISGTGDRVYVRGLEEGDALEYSIYRQGDAYLDPDNNNEVLGYEALHVGDVAFERIGDPSTAVVVRAKREVLLGDRLMPQTDDPFLEFVPRPPERDVNGAIIAVVDGVSQIGQYQVVVLSVGNTSGIVPGNVLGIFQAGREISDPFAPNSRRRAAGDTVRLPEERAGDLLVFRVFDRVSFALVMRTQRPVHVFDRVKNP